MEVNTENSLTTPTSLYQLAAILLHEQLIDLESLLPHVSV